MTVAQHAGVAAGLEEDGGAKVVHLVAEVLGLLDDSVAGNYRKAAGYDPEGTAGGVGLDAGDDVGEVHVGLWIITWRGFCTAGLLVTGITLTLALSLDGRGDQGPSPDSSRGIGMTCIQRGL